MNSHKLDRRVKYTLSVLSKTLLEMLHEMPMGKITVKELCERADVNRGTFYSHFSSPHDLLQKIEAKLLGGILKSIDSSLSSPPHTLNITALITEILHAIEKNIELCRVIFGKYGDKDFLRRVINIAHDRCITEWHKFFPSAKNEELEFVYDFYANGSVAIVQRWIESDMRARPEEIALLINRISIDGLRSLYDGAQA